MRYKTGNTASGGDWIGTRRMGKGIADEFPFDNTVMRGVTSRRHEKEPFLN